MKFSQIIITTIALVSSLNATEIKPYGNFKFGDSLTPVYNSLCSTKSITDIQVGSFSKYISKNDFCKNKAKSFEAIKKTINTKYLYKVKRKEFDNLAGEYHYIKAKGISIKGVDFELSLTMGTVHEKQVIGSYLLTKDDTLKIKKYNVPLQLTEVILKPIDSDILKIHQKEIFEILWKKYGHLARSNDIKRFKKQNSFNAKGEKKSTIRFTRYDGIEYRSDDISTQQIKAFTDYIKNLPKKNKDDSSDDL